MLLSVFVLLLLSSSCATTKQKKKSSSSSSSSSSNKYCLLDPPYLYLTTHDEVPNVLKYTRNGCLLDSAVLEDLPPLLQSSGDSVLRAALHDTNNTADTYYYQDDTDNDDNVHGGSSHLIEYRTMALGSFVHPVTGKVEDDVLFIANAVSGQSAVYAYSTCHVHPQHKRRYIDTIVSTEGNVGADHGYGLCLDQDQHVYMSFQHTNVILRYAYDHSLLRYVPMDLPPTLRRPGNVAQSSPSSSSPVNVSETAGHIYNKPRHYYDYFPGTFYQFGKPTQQKRSNQGVRSILMLHKLSDNSLKANNDKMSNQNFLKQHPNGLGAQLMKHSATSVNSGNSESVIINSVLWIANEDIDGILLVDVSTGMAFNVIVIHNPISLVFDATSNRVYVSSKRKHWEGAVYAINPYTYRVTATYTTNRMNHPTGLLVHENVLYVAELVLAQVLKFDVNTRKYLGVAIDNVPGEIEHILLSSC